MIEKGLSQRARFLALLIDVAVLCLASWFAFGGFFPPNGTKGFWFYTALLGLVLGSRLDTPFFAKPADVVVYAAPAAVALAMLGEWGSWDARSKVAYIAALTYCL